MTLDIEPDGLKLQPSTLPCPLCGRTLLEEPALGYYCPLTVQIKRSEATPHYYRSFSPDNDKYFECSYILPFVVDTFHWKNESRIYKYANFKSIFIIEVPAIFSQPEPQFLERIKLLITLS